MAERAVLKLVHDVLDGQLIDRRGERIGRIDELELERLPNGKLRVAAILVGGPVRAHRVGRVGELFSRVLRAIGRMREPGVSRIPFSLVRKIADTIEVDVVGDELPSSHVELWLRDHFVCRIAGSSGEGK